MKSSTFGIGLGNFGKIINFMLKELKFVVLNKKETSFSIISRRSDKYQHDIFCLDAGGNKTSHTGQAKRNKS